MVRLLHMAPVLCYITVTALYYTLLYLPMKIYAHKIVTKERFCLKYLILAA